MSVDDLGSPVLYFDFRKQVASLPSISVMTDTLQAVLAYIPSSEPPMESTIMTPKSISSQGLSQVDSGFGSPPFFSPEDEDEDEDDGGNISGVEPLEIDDFPDILGDADDSVTASLSRLDGKIVSKSCA